MTTCLLCEEEVEGPYHYHPACFDTQYKIDREAAEARKAINFPKPPSTELVVVKPPKVKKPPADELFFYAMQYRLFEDAVLVSKDRGWSGGYRPL